MAESNAGVKARCTSAAPSDWRETLFFWRGSLLYDASSKEVVWRGTWVGSPSMAEPSAATGHNWVHLGATGQRERNRARFNSELDTTGRNILGTTGRNWTELRAELGGTEYPWRN